MYFQKESRTALRTALGDALGENVPLAPFTTLRIGGPAEFLFRAKSADDAVRVLKIAKEAQVPVTVLGGGSNSLIADEGVKGFVLLMEDATLERLSPTTLKVGAGLRLGKVVSYCAQEGLAGLECLAGIPGTVGGALYGNAGSPEIGLGNRVQTLCVWDGNGIITLNQAVCDFGYRHSRFKTTKEVILDAVIECTSGNPDEIRAAVAAYIVRKNTHQPTADASAGCMFKNPPGLSAGKLIDELGLKGKRLGHVQVSDQHGNFFINLGGATAHEVIQLLNFLKQQARDRRGILLQEEVQLLGFGNP